MLKPMFMSNEVNNHTNEVNYHSPMSEKHAPHKATARLGDKEHLL